MLIYKRFMVEEWHILYLGSILHGFQKVVLHIYDSTRKDLEKLFLHFTGNLKENYFSELIPRVLMEVDFFATNHPPGVVTLKTIQRFKQINTTEVQSADC